MKGKWRLIRLPAPNIYKNGYSNTTAEIDNIYLYPVDVHLDSTESYDGGDVPK